MIYYNKLMEVEMLKITQVAKMFGVSRQTILTWINKKKIKAIQVDRCYLVEEEEIKRIKAGN